MPLPSPRGTLRTRTTRSSRAAKKKQHGADKIGKGVFGLSGLLLG
jgi:hypothetical protein